MYSQACLVAQMVKNLPAMQETRVQSLGWEDPLEEETAIHSSILARIMPWKKSLVGYSPWGHKRDTNEQLSLGVVVVIFWSLCIFYPEFAPNVQAHCYF